MRALFIALAILGSPAMAADFRGSELGGPSALLPEHEKSLGSEEIGNLSRQDQHRFAGRAFDRDVIITYLCKDGSFTLGDYHFPLHSYVDAVPDFQAAYSWLSATYGAPFIEYPENQNDWNDKELPKVGNEPRMYNASWEAAGISAFIVLWVSGDRAGPNWQVFVVIHSVHK